VRGGLSQVDLREDKVRIRQKIKKGKEFRRANAKDGNVFHKKPIGDYLRGRGKNKRGFQNGDGKIEKSP